MREREKERERKEIRSKDDTVECGKGDGHEKMESTLIR
jgi:hypothetical protein